MKKLPRIDPLALPVAWPDLFAQSPDPDQFTHREATISMKLSGEDIEGLHELGRLFRTTAAGVALQTLFAFLYGRYLMVKTRREHSGLFKGFSDQDPAPFVAMTPDTTGAVTLPIPQRMREDLETFASRRSTTAAALSGAIIRAFLQGHPDRPLDGDLAPGK